MTPACSDGDIVVVATAPDPGVMSRHRPPPRCGPTCMPARHAGSAESASSEKKAQRRKKSPSCDARERIHRRREQRNRHALGSPRRFSRIWSSPRPSPLWFATLGFADWVWLLHQKKNDRLSSATRDTTSRRLRALPADEDAEKDETQQQQQHRTTTGDRRRRSARARARARAPDPACRPSRRSSRARHRTPRRARARARPSRQATGGPWHDMV